MGFGSNRWPFIQACKPFSKRVSPHPFTGSIHLQQQHLVTEEKGKESNKEHRRHVYIINPIVTNNLRLSTINSSVFDKADYQNHCKR